MKNNTVIKFLGLISAASLSFGTEVLAQEHKPYSSLGKTPIAQLDSSNTIVTNVQLKTTEQGLEIQLETASPADLQPLIYSQGNDLIIDLPNTALALASGPSFQAQEPSQDITEVTVVALEGEEIRITAKGKTAAPQAQVVPSGQGLTLALTAAPDSQATAEDIEVVATQAAPQNSYFVPNATSATGTSTPIIETPFSVQVVPEDVIRDQQAITIQDTLRNVSGVNFAGTNGGREAIFSIRGFGNQFGDVVPVLRDGYRLYGSFQAIPEVSNLQQVEVLKGPSSILYGQIEPGGVINLVSKKPLTQPFAEVELQIGNQGLVRPHLDLSGPLGSLNNVFYRLNGLYKNESSFRDFDEAMERYSVAPALAWKISEQTDLSLSAEYIGDSGPADFGLSRFGDGVAPVPRSRVINNPDDTIETGYTSAGYNFEHRFSDNWKIRNSFRYLNYNYNYSVVALPFIVDDPIVTRFFADQDGQQQSYSFYTNTVGKFATGSVKHELLAGIDFNWSEDGILTVFGGPSPLDIFNPDYNLIPKPDRSDLPLFGDTVTTSNRMGIYLQDQISLLDNLIFVAGLRYDTINQRTSNIQTNFTEGGNSEQNDSAVTPRLGLLYRPIPELSLFANYSQSFEPGTGITASGEALEPTRGEGFEMGLKTELLEKKLLATLTYFNITKQNVATADPNNPLFSAAIGEQQSQGIELDIVGEVLPGWKIIANYSYIDAKVTQDTDPDFIGNRLFGVPYNSANLWTTYEIQSGNLKGLGFGIGFNYGGDRFGDLLNSYTIGNYFIGNAAIFYNRDNYRLALNFKNIGNAYYIQAVTGNDSGIEPGAPFTVIGSLSVKF